MRKQFPVYKISFILICLFFIASVSPAQTISWNPVTHDNFNSRMDQAAVDTDTYPDIYMDVLITDLQEGLYVAWGGPTVISSTGTITSDQAYTETTLLSDSMEFAKFVDVYNNGRKNVVALDETGNPPNFYIFNYLGNRKFASAQLLFSGEYTGPEYFMDSMVDLEGNGYPDIICESSFYVNTNLRWETIIYWNNNGVFSNNNSTIIPYTRYLGAADFRKTGLKDLVLTSDVNNNGDVLVSGDMEIWIQGHAKTFTLANIYTGGNNGYLPPITIGDFSKNGYPDFVAVKENLVGQILCSNEVELFSNNSGSGFTEIPIWTDITSGEGFNTLGSSFDIKGDGDTDFVIGNSSGSSGWLQAWYCAPLGNSITFETQIVAEGSQISAEKGFIADVNSDGICDIVTQNQIYYGYKQSVVTYDQGGGSGGGPVGPISFGLAAILFCLKKTRKR